MDLWLAHDIPLNVLQEIQVRRTDVWWQELKLWCCRTPLAAGVAQNFVNLSLDILLVVALGVGVVSNPAAL